MGGGLASLVPPYHLGAAPVMDRNEQTDFERAADTADRGIVREFWDFLANNKKWWLLPIVIVMSLFGLLLLFSGTAAAPFIYTLF
jgi:hypothetical protein